MQERGERPSVDLPRTTGAAAKGGLSIKFCIEGGGNVVVLCVTGRLDFVSSATLKDGVQACLNQQRRDLILNLEGVEFLNSTGIGTLVSILKNVRLSGGRLALCSLSSCVDEIVRIAQLSDIFAIYPDQKSAADSFAGKYMPGVIRV